MATMIEMADLPRRIERVCSRASSASADERLLSEMEDLLAEGYLAALTGEARSQQLGARLEHLLETLDEPSSALEARRIALQKRSLDQRVHDLRSRLAVMREQFARLGGGNPATG
jgi:hypothetical protein